jgi:RecA-family ATPase
MIARKWLGEMANSDEKKPRPALRFERLSRLPAPPPRKEIVKGILAAGEIGALVAPPGEGKSAVALLLATCVAEDRDFLGRQTSSGPVMYIAAERSMESTRRLKAISMKTSAPLFMSYGRPDLGEEEVAVEIANAAKAACHAEGAEPALIVFDTLARCTPGLDENSAREMGKVVETLTQLVENVPSAAILFVHHTSKKGNDMRGSNALLGGVDLELLITNSRGAKTLKVTKANSVEEGQRLGFKLELDPIAQVITAVGCELDQDAAAVQEELLNLIRDMSQNGEVNRQACLRRARNEGLVRGKTKASDSELFRRKLVQLKSADQISFTNSKIALVQTPNSPS